jgi:hypothetical protein
MSWKPPKPPNRRLESIVAYWRQIMLIPDDELAAPILREMASERLKALEPTLDARRRAAGGGSVSRRSDTH